MSKRSVSSIIALASILILAASPVIALTLPGAVDTGLVVLDPSIGASQTPGTVATAGAVTAGAAAAAADRDLSIEDMMRYAIEDEYLARAEYELIIATYGVARPFTNIIRAEENHISWLVAAYASRGLSVPADPSASHVVLPASVKAALETGVEAEIANIAMYDSFLSSPLLARPENADLRDLFIRLRDASKNHLAAFRNALSRY